MDIDKFMSGTNSMRDRMLREERRAAERAAAAAEQAAPKAGEPPGEPSAIDKAKPPLLTPSKEDQ